MRSEAALSLTKNERKREKINFGKIVWCLGYFEKLDVKKTKKANWKVLEWDRIKNTMKKIYTKGK